MSSNSVPADALWLATLRAAGRRPKTLEGYIYSLGQCQRWRGDDDLTTLSRFEALSYAKHLTDTYKPTGVASRLKALKAFYNWLMREELATENPFRGVTVKIPDDPRPTADAAQIERMLASARRTPRDLALLTLMVDTGARKGELAAVTMGDVDLTSGTVTFRVSKSRPRTVPLSDRAVLTLGKWLRKRGTGSGSLWSVTDPYSLVRAATARHSRGELSPHKLRRAFAVSWLSRGGTETSLMRLCGWSSREMIALYSRASADVLASDEYRRLMA
jgi:integrase